MKSILLSYISTYLKIHPVPIYALLSDAYKHVNKCEIVNKYIILSIKQKIIAHLLIVKGSG